VKVSTGRTKLPTVLVPVDFSAYSPTACRVAFEYASRTGARVLILHAFMSERHHFFLPFGSDRYDGDAQEVERDEATVRAKAQVDLKSLERALRAKMAAGELPQVPFECRAVEGVPEERILEQASRSNASLIVMGTRGMSQRDHATLGSVTAEVIDAGKFPIITIPEYLSIESFTKIDHVAFLSNLAPQDVLAFDSFSRLMFGKKLKISLIPVVEKKRSQSLSQKSASQLLNYCREHYPDNDFSVANIEFTSDLQEFQNYVTSHQVQLIAVPEKKRNIFVSLFNPGIAHRILFQSDIPMLVVPV